MNANILELSAKFKELKDEHAIVKARLDEINALWTEVETKLLEAMVEEGVNSIDAVGIGKLSMRTENYLSVNAANTDAFYSYMKESGNGGMLKEYVNPRTLQAWLKEHLIEVRTKYVENAGLDEIEARDKALDFLKSKGANYFTKRTIQFRTN